MSTKTATEKKPKAPAKKLAAKKEKFGKSTYVRWYEDMLLMRKFLLIPGP